MGTGFNPELTGRENIYLNGTILGMTRREVQRQFDSIVDFAGTSYFLDTPIKRYSSGMYVRLAFAVAAHLQSEILVLDEVLAVGDLAFQRKCLDKVQDLAHDQGRTVLLVSHNAEVIRQNATSAIRLDSGRLTVAGTVADALDDAAAIQLPTTADLSRAPRVDDNWCRIAKLMSATVTAEGRSVVRRRSALSRHLRGHGANRTRSRPNPGSRLTTRPWRHRLARSRATSLELTPSR